METRPLPPPRTGKRMEKGGPPAVSAYAGWSGWSEWVEVHVRNTTRVRDHRSTLIPFASRCLDEPFQQPSALPSRAPIPRRLAQVV